MSERYPKIRIHARNGAVLLREGVSISFYMRRSHQDVVHGVMQSLESYLRVVGSKALGWYDDGEGTWRELDAVGWAHTRRELLEKRWPLVTLRDALDGALRYGFDYRGKSLDELPAADEPGAVSAVSFWLPTEFLEEHGPNHVRELALELAAPLPFCSGHAGLSFIGEFDLPGVLREIRERCFRHPGLDLPDLGEHSWKVGTRIRAPQWLTFLGLPVLGEVGGTEGLRSRLFSAETTVQEMEGGRAVVTLGPWPEAGDTERGQVLPSYRELACLLEPWLYHEERGRNLDFTLEDVRRWDRRFLG
ncbi:hypothetical protein MEBOL_001090 [Melittangium boletus DSM 14713]|uniref:DUF3396 domain-containing protein n=1 Tax=Melittangium boletus DSM 14713 TaxID=1294270 RepID=A0A250I9K5_9BACT|nr:hypothetical protein MEBOL_001090 [Melittangium boletus DSM 14713]